MKIEAGTIIKTPGMILRIDKITGAYCQTSYKKGCDWFKRGVSEKRAKIADGIKEGSILVLGKEEADI